MDRKQHIKTIIILSPLVFIFALSLDIYSPTIPQLQKALHTTPAMIQLTVTAFALAMGIGQLLIGPFSDRIGRKPIMLIGLVIYIIGSGLCAAASNAPLLIIGRIAQACGCAATMSSAFASVKDIYNDKATHVYSLLNSTIAVVPLIAPIIGGYLATVFNWEANFVFLAIFGVLILFTTATGFKESIPKKGKNKVLTQSNLKIATHPVFIVFTLLSTCGFSCFLAFFSVTPYIIITLLHVSIEHFGYYFATISVVSCFGSLFAAKLISKFGVSWVGLAGAIIVLLSGILIVTDFYLSGLSLIGYLFPILIMGIGATFLMGAGAGGAITPFKNAGFASSLLGCIQFMLAAVITTVLMIWPVYSPLPLAWLITALGTVSAAAIMLLQHFNKQKTL